jgi:hypothetical protein
MTISHQSADYSIGRAIWQAGGARPPTFPEGRVCTRADCTTVLSIYNRKELCSKHQEANPRPPRFGRPQSEDHRLSRRLLTLADFLSDRR